MQEGHFLVKLQAPPFLLENAGSWGHQSNLKGDSISISVSVSISIHISIHMSVHIAIHISIHISCDLALDGYSQGVSGSSACPFDPMISVTFLFKTVECFFGFVSLPHSPCVQTMVVLPKVLFRWI